MNEIYKKYNNNTKYAFIVNLKLEHQQIDLNLTPMRNICEEEHFRGDCGEFEEERFGKSG